MRILHSAAAVRDELEVETTGELGRYLPTLKLKSEYPLTTWSTSHSIIVFFRVYHGEKDAVFQHPSFI